MVSFFRRIRTNIRLVVQLVFTAVTNGYVQGYLSGKIFTGKTKALCVPGLNCYSCPGALGSCPIGSLQAALGDRGNKVPFYVLGFFVIFGAFFGRFVCGWLCPFGLVQDLLYKIKIPGLKKIKILPGDKYLKYLKYVILVVFVIILPMFVVDITGLGKPWFCTYICPSGTLGAGIPLTIVDEGLRSAIGWIYAWKLFILIGIILLSIKVYRPFCRYLCPLGAIYGIFNPISLYKYRIDKDKCTSCGACAVKCKFGIEVYKNPNSPECIRCGECKTVCPHKAIKSSGVMDYINGKSKEMEK